MKNDNRRQDRLSDSLQAVELAEALERQIEFEKLIAVIAAGFISAASGDEDRLINEALEKIARYAGVSGGALILFSETGEFKIATHQWLSENIPPPMSGRANITLQDLPWLRAQLLAGDTCHITDIADLPAAAAAEHTILAADGLKSMIAVPLAADGRLLGALAFVGTRPKQWPAEQLSLLRIAGEIVVGVLRRRQTEAALRKSEAKNKAILDSVPDIMYQVNRAGVILDIKPSRNHPELSSAALPGQSFLVMLPTHFVKPALDAIARTLDSGQGQLFEYYRQDGETAYFEARFAQIGDEEVLIIVRDITERRRSEACDLLLLDIAIKVLEEKPLDDIMVFACRQIKGIFGLPLVWVGRKEADGLVRLATGGDESSEVFNQAEVWWDDSPRGLGPTGTAIRTGQFQSYTIDDERLLPWRDRLEQYGATSGVSFPLRVAGEIFGALTAFAHDRGIWNKRTVVHLTSFAEQLALAIHVTTDRRHLRLLTAGLAAAANAVALIDRAGNIQWVNPAFLSLTGYTDAEVLQKNVGRIEGDLPQRIIDNQDLWRILQSGRTWQGELESRRRDGSLYIAEMTVSPFRDERGEIVNYIAILQDVTSRRRAERQILEARETVARAERISSLGIMAAGIAHEVNQPLNSLKVTADSMLFWHGQGKTPTLAKIMENLEKISRQADRIDDIIKHMRTFVHSGQRILPVPCDVNAAVEESLSLLGAQLAAHGITVEKNLASGRPFVLGSSIQLEEVIINLIVNAMQSLDSGKAEDRRIAVTTVCRQDVIILELSDNGPGISDSIKSKIFEPFFTTRPASEGMGLGLSIVQSIVAAFGGQITLKSGQDGGGVTFCIEFPAFNVQERGEVQA